MRLSPPVRAFWTLAGTRGEGYIPQALIFNNNAMNEVMQAPVEKKIPEKYTVKEVFDSLSYRVTDCDDDYDGFFHLSSDLNGEEIKISIKDILDCIKG